jgi:hypothetical protein
LHMKRLNFGAYLDPTVFWTGGQQF